MIIKNKKPILAFSDVRNSSKWNRNCFDNNFAQKLTDGYYNKKFFFCSYRRGSVPAKYEVLWTNNNLSLIMFDEGNKTIVALIKTIISEQQINQKFDYWLNYSIRKYKEKYPHMEELPEDIADNLISYSTNNFFNIVFVQTVDKETLEEISERLITLGLKLEELNSKGWIVSSEYHRSYFPSYCNKISVKHPSTEKEVFYFSSHKNLFVKHQKISKQKYNKILGELNKIKFPELVEDKTKGELETIKQSLKQKADNKALKMAVTYQIETSPIDEDIHSIIEKAEKQVKAKETA